MFSSFEIYFLVHLHILFYIYYIPDYTNEGIVALAVDFLSPKCNQLEGKLCVYYEISRHLSSDLHPLLNIDSS